MPGASRSDTWPREDGRCKPWIGGSVLCPRHCRCEWAAPLPSTPSPAHLPPPASPAPNPNPRVSRCRSPLVAFLCPSPSSPATGRRPLPGSPTSRPPPPLRPPPAGDPTGGVPGADGFAQPGGGSEGRRAGGGWVCSALRLYSHAHLPYALRPNRS